LEPDGLNFSRRRPAERLAKLPILFFYRWEKFALTVIPSSAYGASPGLAGQGLDVLNGRKADRVEAASVFEVSLFPS
jgi:hypothetical protein